jgi:DNA-binding PadR family transcriptional regulator
MLSEIKTTTAEAILGMLSLKPMSGYELRQTISGSIGNFWNESYGQIYPTLKRLEDRGLVESRDGGRAGSKVFSLTDAGWQRVRDWLAVPTRPSVPRSELLLKVFFGNLVSLEVVMRHLADERERAVANIAHDEAIERQIQRDFAGHPGLPFWVMTARYGQNDSRAVIAWCDETLAQLRQMHVEEVTP